MSLLKTRALVIKETAKGESDKIITVLGKQTGKITLYCRGARNTGSRFMAASQLFSWNDFIVYRGKGFYSLNQAEQIEGFYGMGKDLETLTAGSYFLKTADAVILEGEQCDDILKLLLKSFFILSRGKREPDFVIPVFELKFLQLSGYMPQLYNCAFCSRGVNPPYWFDAGAGGVVCMEHKSGGVKISNAAYAAMDFILNADVQRIYEFHIDNSYIEELSGLSKKALSLHTAQ